MLPPEHSIAKINKMFPALWKDVDSCRAKHSRSWPGWLFLPRDRMEAIMASYLKPPKSDDERLKQFRWIRLSILLAPWRVSKNVYRFDPDIYRALIQTPIASHLPTELFFRLPEWAVYIETPDLDTYFGGKCKGFLASLNFSAEAEGGVKLWLLSFTEDAPPFIDWLHLKDGTTIQESIARSLEAYYAMVSNMKLSHRPEQYALNDVVSHVSKLLNLLLYICQVNSEYYDVRASDGSERLPGNPLPAKTKRGPRWFPPEKPTIWQCGMRQGTELRRALAELSSPQGGTHASPVPHARIAHWHTYIVGEGSRKDPTKGERVLKWVHTVLVNARRGRAGVHGIRAVD
jgi:hypothetical protein